MSEFLGGYGFLLLVLIIVIAGSALTLYSLRASKQGEAPSLLDVLLVWPLIFRIERISSKKTSGRFVIGGIAIALLLIFIGGPINKR